MHATALVLGEDVEALMDPYSEHDPEAVEPTWDWWVIGGRWSGTLLAREGRQAVVCTDPPYGQVLQQVTPDLACDQILRGDLDLDGMRARAAEQADEMWAKAAPVLQRCEPLRTLTQIRQAQEGVSDPWQTWRRQPGMDELMPLVGLFGDPAEDFAGTHEEFIERARMNALPAYAFLSAATGWVRSRTYDEQWNPIPVPGYAQRVNQMVEQAPADTLVTLVDYHC